MSAHWANFAYWFVRHGWLAVGLLLFLENLGLPLPGETALFAAAFLELRAGVHSLIALYIAAVAASVAGAWAGYGWGRWLEKKPALHGDGRRHPRWMRSLRLARRFIERYGAGMIFFARFIDILRFLAAPAAGALAMPRRKFLFWNALGAAAWALVIIVLASQAEHHWRAWTSSLSRAGLALLVLAVFIFYALLHRLHRELEKRMPEK